MAEPNKVLSVNIQNFKNIDHLNYDLDGKSVYVIADNGVGKTSFIQAIFLALTGQEMPIHPIKHGETKGEIEVKFGNSEQQYTAIVKFDASNPTGKLIVKDPDGSTRKSPRTFLNDMVGNVTFDIFDFLRMTPKEQVKFIKEFAGINFDKQEKEHKEVFEMRKENNLRIKTLKGAIDEKGYTEIDFKTFAEPKPTDALEKQIKEIDSFNSKVQHGRDLLNTLKTRKTSCDNAVTTAQNRAKEIDGEIEQLEAKIKTLIDEREKAKDRSVSMAIVAKVQEGHIDRVNTWLANNPTRSASEITEKQRQLITFNNKVKDVQSVIGQMEQITDMEKVTERYTARLKEIDKEKLDIISKAKLPMRGLGFEEDYLTINGIPLSEEQMPKSHLIRAGLEIMYNINQAKGGMHICRIKDGSLLGSVKNDVIQMLNELNYQVFIELVDEEQKNLQIEFIEQ